MRSESRDLETDIIYNQYPHSVIERLAKAMGVEEKTISSKSMQPERYFYGACLGYAIENYGIATFNEKDRGTAIKHLADQAYKTYLADFQKNYRAAVETSQGAREKVFARIEEYIKILDASCATRDHEERFDPLAFRLQWAIKDDAVETWRKNAYDNYARIRSHIEDGTLIADREISECASLITKLNWDFNLMQNVARSTLENISKPRPRYANTTFKNQMLSGTNRLMSHLSRINSLDEQPDGSKPISDVNVDLFDDPDYPIEQPGRDHTIADHMISHLTPVGTIERLTQGFLGPVGGGKTTAMRATCERHHLDKYDFMLLDPDYLKPALGISAKRKKDIKDYTGYTVHNESSSIVLETWERLSRDAKLGKSIPNVITCTDNLNQERLEGMLAGGGRVEFHFLGASTDVAKKSCDMRPVKRSKIERDDVEKSVNKSARALPLIAQFGGSRIETYLYERDRAEGTPRFIGVMDMRTREVVVRDVGAFLKLDDRVEKMPKYPVSKRDKHMDIEWVGFVESAVNNGLTIYTMKKDKPSEPEYRLFKLPGKKPQIEYIAQGKEPETYPPEIEELKNRAQCERHEKTHFRQMATKAHVSERKIY